MPLQITAVDSVSGTTLTYSATGLPPGISIDSATGIISGTPTTAGTYSVTVTVRDNLGVAGSASFSWFISGGGGGGNTVTLSNPGAINTTVGTYNYFTISGTDSASGQSLTFNSNNLPSGISINQLTSTSASVSGIPYKLRSTKAVTITATDTTGVSASQNFNWTTTGTTQSTRVAELIGAICSSATSCPSNVNSWLSVNNAGTLGPMNCNKMFYSPNDTMTTFSSGHKPTDKESNLPAGTTIMVCFRDVHAAALPGYVNSIPAGKNVIMVYQNEAEGSFTGTPAQFVSNFETYSNTIRAQGNPSVSIGQVSLGYQYGVSGSTAQQGQWVVPPQFVDYYFVDSYQKSWDYPTNGLSNFNSFQKWLGVFAGQGKPLGIAEYGITGCTVTPNRNTRMQADAAYLRSIFGGGTGAVSPFPLFMWAYWYSNCQAGQIVANCDTKNQFTTTAEQTTWANIANGVI